MLKSTLIGIVLVQLACQAACAVASIENEPVKVTLQNAGPSYDWTLNNEVERTRLVPPQPSSAESEPEADGHLIIRRIFLIPVHGPSTPSGSDSTESQETVERPNPFSLFQSPSFFPWRRQPSFRQPAEADSAIERPLLPTFMNPGEREESQERPQAAGGVDPLQLMINIMKQSLQEAARVSIARSNSAKQPAEKADKESPLMPNPLSELDKPNKSDETTEEVVEVGGKKYLRKLVVTKHLGDNLFFVTRRLVFTPLNETAPDEETTTTSTTSSTGNPQVVTTEPSTESFLDAKSEQPSPPSVVASSTTSTTTTTTTSTTTTEAPTTTPAGVTSTVSSTTAGSLLTEPSSTAGEELTTTVKPSAEVASSTTTNV